MSHYRLYIGEASRTAVARVIEEFAGDDYVMYNALGQWGGNTESTIVVSVKLNSDDVANHLASTLAYVFGQSEIMLTRHWRPLTDSAEYLISRNVLTADTTDNYTCIPAIDVKYRYFRDIDGFTTGWNVNRRGRITPIH